MKLNMIRPKNKAEELFFPTTQNCETLSKRTHRKAEETLEVKFNKP